MSLPDNTATALLEHIADQESLLSQLEKDLAEQLPSASGVENTIASLRAGVSLLKGTVESQQRLIDNGSCEPSLVSVVESVDEVVEDFTFDTLYTDVKVCDVWLAANTWLAHFQLPPSVRLHRGILALTRAERMRQGVRDHDRFPPLIELYLLIDQLEEERDEEDQPEVTAILQSLCTMINMLLLKEVAARESGSIEEGNSLFLPLAMEFLFMVAFSSPSRGLEQEQWAEMQVQNRRLDKLNVEMRQHRAEDEIDFLRDLHRERGRLLFGMQPPPVFASMEDMEDDVRFFARQAFVRSAFVWPRESIEFRTLPPFRRTHYLKYSQLRGLYPDGRDDRSPMLVIVDVDGTSWLTKLDDLRIVPCIAGGNRLHFSVAEWDHNPVDPPHLRFTGRGRRELMEDFGACYREPPVHYQCKCTVWSPPLAPTPPPWQVEDEEWWEWMGVPEQDPAPPAPASDDDWAWADDAGADDFEEVIWHANVGEGDDGGNNQGADGIPPLDIEE